MTNPSRISCQRAIKQQNNLLVIFDDELMCSDHVSNVENEQYKELCGIYYLQSRGKPI